MKKTIYRLGLWSLILTMFVACKEESTETAETIASFQSQVGTENFFEVTFINGSSNYVSSSWEFGDGNTSTQDNPVHIYAEAGTYEVTLTVTSANGATDSRTNSIEIVDPLAAQRALFGDQGKTWYLLADPSTGLNALQVGPAARNEIWFAVGGTGNIVAKPCVRECIFNDTWTFNPDGTYAFDNNGDLWREGGVWTEEGCINSDDPTAFNGVDGDLSDWNSGTHDFTYDVAAQTLTVNGGYVGIAKAGTNAEVNLPQTSVTYNILKLVTSESAADTLVLETTFETGDGTPAYWQSILVSYQTESDVINVTECQTGVKDIISDVNFDFEGTTPAFNVFGGTDDQGGGMVYSVINNPDQTGENTSAQVASLEEPVGSKFYSGTSVQLEGYVNFDNKRTFSVKVWSPIAGATVKFKMEDSQDASTKNEVDKTITTANTWETLTFEFPVEDSEKFDVLVLFFDFDPNGDQTPKVDARTHYFDDIVLQ